MSILKSNNADITEVLDQVKKEFHESCQTTFLNDMTEDGLLRDANNVPIHKNDMVWLLPDLRSHEVVKLGRVIGNSVCFVNIHLGIYSNTKREIIVRKKPCNVMVVSMDEVRRIIEKAKNQK